MFKGTVIQIEKALIKDRLHFSKVHFFYKQSIFDSRPENCLSFSKNSPQKIV